VLAERGNRVVGRIGSGSYTSIEAPLPEEEVLSEIKEEEGVLLGRPRVIRVPEAERLLIAASFKVEGA
jgi:hypothetical protein